MPNQDIKHIVAVSRAHRFSPNSIEKDRLILERAAQKTASLIGIDSHEGVETIDECDLHERVAASYPLDQTLILSMARSDDALDTLAGLEQRGSVVVNSPHGVRTCQRSVLDKLMRINGIAMPPRTGHDGYWLKRGDASAQSKDDIRFCHDEAELEAAREEFRAKGISEVVVSSHVVGDLVKFYGVEGTPMFRFFYPGDDGISKFGDEERNGKPHHYVFREEALHSEANRLAQLTGVTVYGGDAIVDGHGNFYIIDFNDWPSFSRCREEAAEAIALAATTKL